MTSLLVLHMIMVHTFALKCHSPKWYDHFCLSLTHVYTAHTYDGDDRVAMVVYGGSSTDLEVAAGLVVAAANHMAVEGTKVVAGLVVAGLVVAVDNHKIVEGTQVVAGLEVPESGIVVDADDDAEVVQLAESHACLKK